MERLKYLLLITDTFFETRNPIASEPAEPFFELRKELFHQILTRKQKVAEQLDFVTKDEFILQCSFAVDNLNEYVSMQSFIEINRLHKFKKDLENEKHIADNFPFDNYFSPTDWKQKLFNAQFEIDFFDTEEYLVNMGGLSEYIQDKLCEKDVFFIKWVFEDFDILINQTIPKQPKSNKSLLFDGKELNLSERFKIANKVLDIDTRLRTLNIKDLEKYQLLAYILGCDKDNARNIMNGSYNSKDRDLTTYFNELNLKE